MIQFVDWYCGLMSGRLAPNPALAAESAMTQMNWTAKPWTESEPLECAMVVPEVGETATFTFRAPSGAWFACQPVMGEISIEL